MSAATIAIFLTFLALTAILGRRIGFRAQDPGHYADSAPALDIRRHLSGPLVCEGVIFGPTGRMASRFRARMKGRWDGHSGVLDEAFIYASGQSQNRAWHLTVGNDGRVSATAEDVVGTARGEQSGATLRMRYRLRLPEDAGGYVLSVTDWMYLMENGTIMNRAEMRKFGIKVAELVATIRPAND